MKSIGNAIPQLDRTEDLERYKSVLEANARQSLKQIHREDSLDQVEYFFNHYQKGMWTCGWKVDLDEI